MDQQIEEWTDQALSYIIDEEMLSKVYQISTLGYEQVQKSVAEMAEKEEMDNDFFPGGR